VLKNSTGTRRQAGGVLLGLLLLALGAFTGFVTLKLVIELFQASFFGFKAIVGPMLALICLLTGGPITYGLLATGFGRLSGR